MFFNVRPNKLFVDAPSTSTSRITERIGTILSFFGKANTETSMQNNHIFQKRTKCTWYTGGGWLGSGGWPARKEV